MQHDPDEPHAPLMEASARGLGVRPDYDIAVDAEGNVAPNGEGMTVRPSAGDIPRQFRKGRFSVWSLDTEMLPEGLEYEQDSPTHGVVQPAWVMPYEEFAAGIDETRPLWQQL
jgi:hypothetical protein